MKNLAIDLASQPRQLTEKPATPKPGKSLRAEARRRKTDLASQPSQPKTNRFGGKPASRRNLAKRETPKVKRNRWRTLPKGQKAQNGWRARWLANRPRQNGLYPNRNSRRLTFAGKTMSNQPRNDGFSKSEKRNCFTCPTAGVTGKGGSWREKPPDAESASWGRFPESAANGPHLSGARGVRPRP